MIKADIVKQIATRLDIKEKDALFVADSIIHGLKEVILRDGRLEIRDFGVFQIKERKQRIGRNPKNKKEYPIPSRRVVTFKSGKEIKELDLEGEQPPESE